jgi:hypothetical protein
MAISLTHEEAFDDVRSATAFLQETSGPDSLLQEDPIQDVFLEETVLADAKVSS